MIHGYESYDVDNGVTDEYNKLFDEMLKMDDADRTYGPWKRIFIISREVNKKRVWFQWYFVRRVTVGISNLPGAHYTLLEYAKTEFDVLKAV